MTRARRISAFTLVELLVVVSIIAILIAILVPPASLRITVAFVAVLVGLSITGLLSARLGGSSKKTAVTRLIFGGALAMGVTFGIGRLIGTAVG